MIELANVGKSFQNGRNIQFALKNISLNIDDGEFVCIRGKSGSGKTTLLNLIGLVDKIEQGKYMLNGVDVNQLGPLGFDHLRRDNIGFVFQNYELMNRYTVRENIELPLLAKRISYRERKKKVEAVLNHLGIEKLSKMLPGKLSGGEKQRVAIARAYVTDNPIIIADEPTGALDTENAAIVMNMFREINENGRTIILVTHDDDVAKYGTRTIELVDGVICPV